MVGETVAAVMQCSAVLMVGWLDDAVLVHGHCCLFSILLAPLSAGGKSVHTVLHVRALASIPELLS